MVGAVVHKTPPAYLHVPGEASTQTQLPTPAVVSALKTLPWESRADFASLRRDMYSTYQPVGPMECHLLDELVMTIWRKRRFYEAEAAALRDKAALLVSRASGPISGETRHMTKAALLGVATTHLPDTADIESALTHGQSDQKAADKATQAVAYWEDLVVRLRCGQLSAKVAIRDCLTDWRDEWREGLRNEEYARSADGVAEFITDYPLHQAKLDLLNAHSGEVRDYIAGRALAEHTRAGTLLLRFEAHLDSKTRNTLQMLLNLQRTRMGG